jgi:hypothetical protein
MNQAIPEQYNGSPGLQFVLSQGWNWVDAGGGQIKIENCPFCRKGDYKFFMAVMKPQEGTRDGLYTCFHGSCGQTGNLRRLQEHLGTRIPGVESRAEFAGRKEKADDLPDVEACHGALLGDAEVLDYLINVRGFTQEIIEKQKLGLKEKVYFKEAGEVRALVIPYLVNGNIVFAKYRTLPPSPKDFSAPRGWEVPLYNGEILKEGLNEILFVEGEADALACLSHGIQNVVGVPGANLRKTAWIEALDRIAPDKIYILYDNDNAGTKGAQELASRIGIEKCHKLVLPKFTLPSGLPGKDVNDWLKNGGTLEQFEDLKKSARQFDVTGVTPGADALTQLEEVLENKVDLSPTYVSKWKALNQLVGFEDGDVIDILAPEKVGKTTFGLNLIDDMVAEYGEDGLIVCLEMTQVRLARKWVSKLTGFEDVITQPGTPEAAAKLDELKQACAKARQIQLERKGDLYFAYPMMVKTPQDIFNLIVDCIRRYGVKWVMFDNLQRLCDDTLENKAHRTVHLSQISKGFAKLAKDWSFAKVKLIRILQPRQIGDTEIISTEHTDGSSQIRKDCDCMMTLWRNPTNRIKRSQWENQTTPAEGNQSFDPMMLVNVGLSRYSSGGHCKLMFDGARSQVKEFDASQAMYTKKFNELIPQGTVPTEASAPLAQIPTEGVAAI